MKSVIKSTVISLAVASLAFAGTSAAPAASGSFTPRIIGGSQAPNTPWEVQLVFVQDGTSYGCTGEAISSEWVLTAKHCVDGISSMKVYYSNSTSNRGSAIAADNVYASSAGDVGLVHFSQSKSLSSYPALADSYQANEGDSGLIMG
ncbi:serine protease, trypsin family [Renibacterium salmoninarum ATCC 33209]|uniref:Serine protease, trypsin family n=1 Tax=Renibacterium salmoninarum (strain ATCC 33209 / DSM 20767 / JCM 11484 / NBRC 15589 / NCIMB 2235) TaxID=288705 RepID=A9WN53_RENSM|nr:trypsin-like serine protease [Renibacterium salmoninarum]ABY22983.1 serine protease, trypsin family [Renibacterium salmoninarum ATCC 33209]